MRGVTRRLKQSWTPDGFARGCGEMSGEMPVELVEIRTGAEFTQPLRAFFNGFGRPDLRPRPPGRSRSGGGGGGAAGEESLLKLKDWPPTKDSAELPNPDPNPKPTPNPNPYPNPSPSPSPNPDPNANPPRTSPSCCPSTSRT